MSLGDKISNIIGVPIPEKIFKQLRTRSKMNSLEFRSMENVKYLENKTAWVRLISSVNLTDQEDIKYFRSTGALIDSNDPSSLAKQFVLFGGISAYQSNGAGGYYYQPRSGVFEQPSAYSPLGNNEIRDFGYRPMPGIMDVSIETQGRLGSVRQAKINFKCWDKYQLDIMDTLYFKLGFTMFLEWGNTYFYSSEDLTTLRSTELYSSQIDPFQPGLFKEDIMSRVAKLNRDTEGNYDAMLGMVTNFNFSMNQEGGYDCSLTMISLGILAESIKINTFSSGNNILTKALETYNKNFEAKSLEQAKQVVEQGNFNITLYTPQSLTETILGQTDPKKIPYQLIYPSNVTKDQPQLANIYFTAKEGGSYVSRLLIQRGGKSYIVVSGGDAEDNACRIDSSIFRDTLKKSIFTTPVTGNNRNGNIGNIGEDLGLAIYRGGANGSLTGTYKGDNGDQYTIRFSYSSEYNLIEGEGEFDAQFDDEVFNSIKQNLSSQVPSTLTKDQVTEVDVGEFSYTIGFFGDNEILNKVVEYQNTKGTDEERRINSIRDVMKKLFDYFDNSDVNFIFTTGISNDFRTEIKLKTYFTLEDVVVGYKKEDGKTATAKGNVKVPFNFNFTLFFGDSNLIKAGSVNSRAKQATGGKEEPQDPATVQGEEGQLATNNAASGSNPTQQATDQTSSTEATQDPISVMSSLEATLFAIKVHTLDKTTEVDLKNGSARSTYVDLTQDDFYKSLFSNGVFSSFLEDLKNGTIDDTDFDKTKNRLKRLKIGAKYGFATNLMLGYTPLYSRGKKNFYQVNYPELLRSYTIGYEFSPSGLGLGTKTEKPVYISFGLLMMILNSNCTIYDTTEKSSQTPLIYIDFNPNHNVCLSCPQHLSVDPWTAMIPFEGGDKAFESIFPSEILTIAPSGNPAIKAKSDQSEATYLFRPLASDEIKTNGDRVSDPFPSFHIPSIVEGEVLEDSKISSFKGYIMNILLNTDYLAGIVRDEASKNDENKVFLKSFIEQVLVDLNKCLGNFNTFRMSYNDGANCIQVVDDQLIPTGKEAQLNRNSTNTILPLFGLDSIAKTLEVKTEISTRLSNMIAISANSGAKTANGTDASSYGFINTKLKDRYISNRSDIKKETPPDTEEGAEILSAGISDSDVLIELAVKFNSAIKSIYGPAANPSKDEVSAATNFYVDQLSLFKATDPNVQASGMIPVSINFSTDGISGLTMGHSFTVPDRMLPYVYSSNRKPPYAKSFPSKVGFVIIGLSNSIRNNVWTTSINSNMIFLKDNSSISSENAVARAVIVPQNLQPFVTTDDPAKTKNEKGEYAVWEGGKIKGYEPVVVIQEGGRSSRVLKKYYDAYKALQAAAKSAGHDLFLVSGFRTYDEQLILRRAHAPSNKKNDMEYLINGDSKSFNPLTAKPGYSPHQNGIGFDLLVRGRIPLFKWLEANALKYGFLRVVPSERWHWNYRPDLINNPKGAYYIVPQTHISWKQEDF